MAIQGKIKPAYWTLYTVETGNKRPRKRVMKSIESRGITKSPKVPSATVTTPVVSLRPERTQAVALDIVALNTRAIVTQAPQDPLSSLWIEGNREFRLPPIRGISSGGVVGSQRMPSIQLLRGSHGLKLR